MFFCAFNFSDAQNSINEGAVKLASVFGNSMVLQQNEPINIWGESTPGTTIKAQLGVEEQATITDSNGKWQVTFKALKASFRPIVLNVNNLKIENILIGEVWLCSGQSNMAFQLKNMAGYDTIANQVPNKNIRFLKHSNIRIVAKNGYTEEELARCNTQNFFQAKWEESTLETSEMFSAVAWVFANGLHKKLKVPIGIIQVAVGGSAINNWIPKDALQSNPLTAHLFKTDWLSNEHVKVEHRNRAKEAFQKVLNANEPYRAGQFKYRWLCEPSFLFEAGIAPLKNMAFRGVLWYQGESDTDTMETVNNTKTLFPLMVNEWRKYFNIGDFPFLYVQLPAYKSQFWPEFREIQQQTLEEVENTSMVVTIDLGLETNIHPTDKYPVGDRASKLALKNVYGFDEIIGFPKLKKWTLNNQEIALTFEESGKGIFSSSNHIAGFEIGNQLGEFYMAETKLVDGKVIVKSPIENPASLRYGWTGFPKPALSLFNSANLPLGPFFIQFNKF
ncbi:sialate O-acetylesterase [Mariniflexile fucanivorans]|uniref:sialate O-acetylesterase n=1 Tax=Mariniflexile fucanivorans TaxID=264023 RepID=UPI0014054E8D|nr:sialate O-acetylesterase [Mariniflexile fucanivorans]